MGWVGVVLHGTLAEYVNWDNIQDSRHMIGAPIHDTVQQVRAWLAEGRDVRILTQKDHIRPDINARASKWCDHFLGITLPVVNAPDAEMEELLVRDRRGLGWWDKSIPDTAKVIFDEVEDLERQADELAKEKTTLEARITTIEQQRVSALEKAQRMRKERPE